MTRPQRNRIRRLGLGLACLLAAWMILGNGAAQATYVHNYEGSFNASETPRGSFGVTQAAAVDNSSGPSGGDVYIGAAPSFGGESTIQKFEGDGTYAGVEFGGSETPQGSFGIINWENYARGSIAVDGSAGSNSGALYVADVAHQVVDRFGEGGEFICQITGRTPASAEEEEAECAGAAGSETPSGGFGLTTGVAVDPATGNVYVSDAANRVVDEFNEAGEYVGHITDSHLTQPASLALDSTGSLYVDNGALFGGENVVKFDSSGTYTETLEEGQSPNYVVTDPGIDHAYILRSGTLDVADYDSAGTLLGTFGQGKVTGYAALAASAATGDVYATQLFGEVLIFGPGMVVPEVSTGEATEIAETTATLHGEAAPDTEHSGGDVTSCEFEYISEYALHHRQTVNPNSGGSFALKFEGQWTSLLPGTASAEEVQQALEGLTAVGAGNVAVTGPAGGPYTVEFVGALQDAEVPSIVENNEVTVTGDWSGAETVPCQPVAPYSEPTAVKTEVTGLTAGRRYRFRLLAADAEGQASGEYRTFNTHGPPAIIKELSNARVTSAGVRASINPEDDETTCEVQYVDQETYEASGYEQAKTTPCPEAVPAGFGYQQVHVTLAGLKMATTYHFRFVARNAAITNGGVTFGADKTFSTFKIESLSVEAINEEGEPETLAGAHPYELRVKFTFNTTDAQFPYVDDRQDTPGNLKTARVELPPGLIGNPTATPKCTSGELKQHFCSPDAEIGHVNIYSAQTAGVFVDGGLYNLVPPTGVAAEFGAQFSTFPSVRIDSGVRTGSDYGVDSVSVAVNADSGIDGVEVIVWGVPADESHEHDCRTGPPWTGCPSTAPKLPLLSNPTSCTGPLSVNLAVDTWQQPGVFTEHATELPAITGCNQVQFEPHLEARPTTNVADSPSGLSVDLEVPQNEDPEGRRIADLRDASVTLPQGMTLNPSGANGLAACSPDQFDIHGTGPANCPDASKIGTVEVESPLVDHPLAGSVYLASPHDNPFGSLVALYLGINDPETGVVIKLAGKVNADSQTGQLTTTFSENPQLPFEHLRLRFFEGAKAPLRTPAACGTYQTTSSLTPWSAPESGPPATPSDSYAISQAPGGGSCPAEESQEPNAPGFEAGTVTPLAGAYSPFVLHLHREDGSQQISQLTVTPPAGLLAKLAGTAYCPDAALAAAGRKSGAEEQASPSCPTSSQVGTVHVSAGAGPAPYWVTGTAYLAGPYRGAPLSLAIVTPAVAGPFDLGTVVVRSALEVDPVTTQVTVKSDPIPRILEGIPLDIRTISVALDKSEFIRNPTNCNPASVNADAISLLNQTADLTQRFQVGDCGALSFKPKLTLNLKGKTRRAGNPALTATLTMPQGSADVSSAQVTLPHAEFLDQGHIRTVCTRVQFGERACPAGSVYGHAKAFSPLLGAPLEGPVYLRSNGGERTLPDLVADLSGQIHVVLVGFIDSKGGGIRTTFASVPDAPVSKFVLQMQGGRKGLLENHVNICARPHFARARFAGHSGKEFEAAPKMGARCQSRRHGQRRHH
jgi:hypothetical protein